jgi:hypothetical protein
MRVVLEPTLFGQPIALDEPVQVRFRRPDGVSRTIDLLRDVHGSYQGVFDDTSLHGPYQAVAEVSISSAERGIRLSRCRYFTGIILSPGQVDGDGDLGRECCEDLKHLLSEILVTLKECCGEKEDPPRLGYDARVALLREIASSLAKMEEVK